MMQGQGRVTSTVLVQVLHATASGRAGAWEPTFLWLKPVATSGASRAGRLGIGIDDEVAENLKRGTSGRFQEERSSLVCYDSYFICFHAANKLCDAKGKKLAKHSQDNGIRKTAQLL